MADATYDVGAFYRATGGTPPAQTATTTNAAPGYDVNAFLAKTGGPTSIQSASPLPLSEKALAGIPDAETPEQAIESYGQQQLADEASYIQKNQESGVPFDTLSGADVLTRLKTGAQRNKMEQLRVLRQMYGNEKVRFDTEGNFVVRTTGEDGKPKDLLVDEKRLTARDLLDLTSELPALALSLATTKGVPISKVFQTALRGAAGYFAGGALTDTIARMFTGQDIQPDEILASRTKEGAVNAVGGYALGKVFQLGGMMTRLGQVAASKLADTSQAAAMKEIDMARQRVATRTGVEMEPTLAELTGNPMALRLEAFLSNIPFARSLILRNWSRQIENEKAVQSALGAADVPDLGERLIKHLGGEMQQTSATADAAMDAVQKSTGATITDPLSAVSGGPISSYQFGSRMIRRGEAQLQSFKNRAAEKFDLLRSQPDANALNFDVGPIKGEWNAIRSELVSSATTGEPIKELAPSGVGPLLDKIQELPDRASYFDLVSLRNAIYDRIDSPEPISSKGTQLLKRFGHEITSQLESQGQQVLSPNTQSILKDANDFYRENVDTFYQKGIQSMLKPRTEAGAIDPERVSASLIAGGKGSVTTYNTFRDFFEKGGAVKDMNRLLRDHVVDAGTDQATGLIRLEDLSNAVSKMEPEIVQQLFGQSKDSLLALVQLGQTTMRQGTKGFRIPERGTQAAVEADRLTDLLNRGALNGTNIRDLIDATRTQRLQYANTIRKAVAENDMGVIEASPETFAKDYLFNSSTKLADVKDVLVSLAQSADSALIGDVKRVYLAEIFSNAAKEGKGDPAQHVARITGSPLREVDPQLLALQLQDKTTRDRMELILGKDSFEGLKDFALAIGGRSQRDVAGMLTGAFTGGSMFHKLLHGLEGLPELPQYMALSYVVTSPKLMQMVRGLGQMSPKAVDNAMRAVVLSPEFARVIAADSRSPDQARKAVQDIRTWAQPK